MSITPWIRSYNYQEDYFRTLYEIYSEHYIACYPVTYYSLDVDSTIWDKEKINAGSYEKGGVGELSGVKWKKIQLLPVFGLEQVNMNQSSDEKGGMTYKDGASTQVLFPSVYGLKPLEGDVVDLSFGYKTPAINNKMLFTVNNINQSHMGDFFQIYQCQLKMAPFNREDVEKQISTDWAFYEHEKTIVPLTNFRRLMKLQQLSVDLATTFNRELFDKQTGLYLYPMQEN